MTFYFKNIKKEIILTEEDEEDFKISNICRFCEKINKPDKVRDHCHLIGKNGGPANNTCNMNDTQKQSNFVPFTVQNFGIYGCHLFFFV